MRRKMKYQRKESYIKYLIKNERSNKNYEYRRERNKQSARKCRAMKKLKIEQLDNELSCLNVERMKVKNVSIVMK